MCSTLQAPRLSMVSGNGINDTVPRPTLRSYRKMADSSVQCVLLQADDNYSVNDSNINSTVVEINTPTEIKTTAEINGCASLLDQDSSPTIAAHPTLMRPHSVESTASTSSSNKSSRPLRSDEEDIDAICVEPCEKTDLEETAKIPCDKTEPDGFMIEEDKVEESSCALDCVYVTMKCCECSIM